jgi:FAD/FMN-containing dehydrogenase/pimeloyl-ACP methyl ester carboxylesterase
MTVTTTIDVTGLEGGDVRLTAAQIDELESRLEGAVLRAGADGWDHAVRVWNAMVASVPALVVQPVSADDVAVAVGFAREHGLRLSIKGGGHSIAGIAIAEGGLTLDMSRMRHIDVDATARLAHVGPGCLLADVDRATQEHGLATVLGFISEVGVAGLTLGGGLGYLTRRFGWTVDNLEQVEIVTADGDIRIADRSHNAELFWALRGAGANFGVVTRFTFRLHELGPTVFGGLIAWPFERADEILAAYRSITATAPRELAVWLVMFRAPPAPFVPAEWHGERLAAMAVCYSGDVAGTDSVLAPIRALGEPVVDLLAQQPYTQVQSYLDATEPKGKHYYWKTEFLAELPDDLLSTVRKLFADCPIPDGDIGILHLAGAINDREPGDGAVGNRDARYAIGIKGMWDPTEPDADRFPQWVRDAWSQVRPFSTGATYINFQTADEDDERIRATYGASFDRLLDLKRAYDPANLFRTNRNLREATRAAGHTPAPNGLRDRLLEGAAVRDRRMDLAGIPTAVLDGGRGAPMVLLHSSGEFAGLWRRVLPELVKTHHVIAPDLPGHGASGVPDGPLDVDRTAAWLGALIERTCPSPPVLVGRGPGGAIAARYAVGHSDHLERLVLVGAFGLAPFEPAPGFALALNQFMAQPTAQTRDALFEQCFVDLNRLREQMGQRWEPLAGYALERARSSIVRASAADLMRYFGLSAIPEEDLDRITVQTSLIWGRNDLSVPLTVGEVAHRRYGWPLHTIDGAGDDPPLEQPSTFLTALHTALGSPPRA